MRINRKNIRMYCNVYPYFDFCLQIPLEARKHDLSLTRFETINNRRNGTSIIRHREENQFVIHKVGYWDTALVVVHERSGLDVSRKRLND
jgi:hypothetical protein